MIPFLVATEKCADVRRVLHLWQPYIYRCELGRSDEAVQFIMKTVEDINSADNNSDGTASSTTVPNNHTASTDTASAAAATPSHIRVTTSASHSSPATAATSTPNSATRLLQVNRTPSSSAQSPLRTPTTADQRSRKAGQSRRNNSQRSGGAIQMTAASKPQSAPNHDVV